MIERSTERFELYPAKLMGDSAYGPAEMPGWLVYEHGIEPHVTVFDKSARQDGTSSRDGFTFVRDHNSSVRLSFEDEPVRRSPDNQPGNEPSQHRRCGKCQDDSREDAQNRPSLAHGR